MGFLIKLSNNTVLKAHSEFPSDTRNSVLHIILSYGPNCLIQIFFLSPDSSKTCNAPICRQIYHQESIPYKGVNQPSKDVTQAQQQRPESSTVAVTCHASKYKVYKVNTRQKKVYKSLCTLDLLSCQVRVIRSGLCCYVCVTSSEGQLTPLCVDS